MNVKLTNRDIPVSCYENVPFDKYNSKVVLDNMKLDPGSQ